MNEYIVKTYNDVNGEISSIQVEQKITRCLHCNQHEKTSSPAVLNCCFWNRVVPVNGFCYLGNEETK